MAYRCDFAVTRSCTAASIETENSAWLARWWRLCCVTEQLHGARDEFGVVWCGTTAWQHESILEADAHVVSGGRTRRHDLPVRSP
jgi:hypothetical protein